MKLLITSFDANYGRQGEIWIDRNMCHLCLQYKFCLIIDSSEGEYGHGAICLECITKSFKDVIEMEKTIDIVKKEI